MAEKILVEVSPLRLKGELRIDPSAIQAVYSEKGDHLPDEYDEIVMSNGKSYILELGEAERAILEYNNLKNPNYITIKTNELHNVDDSQ